MGVHWFQKMERFSIAPAQGPTVALLHVLISWINKAAPAMNSPPNRCYSNYEFLGGWAGYSDFGGGAHPLNGLAFGQPSERR